MNIQHVRYFIELAHTHNYSLSAERLCTTQSNLSYAITQLENELGVPLFYKDGRTNILTPYGVKFLRFAKESVKTLDTGVSVIHEMAQGTTSIRLGFLRYLGTRYIPTLLKQFSREYPDYDIDWIFETGSTRSLLDGLDRGRFDAVFCSPSRPTRFHSIKVSDQELMIVVPFDHPLAKEHTEISLSQTKPYPYVYYAKGSNLRNISDQIFARAGFTPDIRYEVMEELTAAGFVMEGFGVSIVPNDFLIKYFPVKRLPITDVRASRDILALYDEPDSLPVVTADFIRFVSRTAGREGDY